MGYPTYPVSNHTSPWAGFQSEGSIVPDRLVIEPGLGRVITIPAGSGVIPRGAVVGAISANGKYIVAAKAATDGSQVPDMIVADCVDSGTTADPTGATDVQTVAWYTGRYNTNALTIGAGYVVADIVAAFRTKSVFFETSLT